jgi:hypothetical protein
MCGCGEVLNRTHFLAVRSTARVLLSAASMRALAAAVCATLFSLCLLAACSSSGDSACSCAAGPVGLVLHAPAGAVSAITLLGSACSDAQLRCVPMDFSSQFTPGCAEYQVLASQGGSCSVHVESSMGTGFDTTAEMIDHGSGCCGGVYAQGDADIPVEFAESADASPE